MVEFKWTYCGNSLLWGTVTILVEIIRQNIKEGRAGSVTWARTVSELSIRGERCLGGNVEVLEERTSPGKRTRLHGLEGRHHRS